MSDVEKDIETVACRMVGMNEQHALQAWTNLIRLARLGAAVEIEVAKYRETKVTSLDEHHQLCADRLGAIVRLTSELELS